MTISNAEQYLLELMNRARLDPAGEAARFGIDLNDGLPRGTISASAKQVLAPNLKLEAAATGHSLWMLENDTFSHTGAGGSDPGARMAAQGYRAMPWGENLASKGSTGPMTLEANIEELNQILFKSALHRNDLMVSGIREVGIGAETGVFTQAGTNFNAVMLTEDFGATGTSRFVTGVCYSDTDANQFYSMGEGKAGVSFTVGAVTGVSAAAGGYAVAAGTSASTVVSGSSGALAFQVNVDLSRGNVKLDLVDDIKFLTSGNITLISGINNAELLGVDNLNATGNAAANLLTGNTRANQLFGLDGNDVLNGLGGNDVLSGGNGRDSLSGGAGNDTLSGGAGNDRLSGASGADSFVFAGRFGVDRITDFRIAEQDRLSFSHFLWSGSKTAADVVNQFAHVGINEVVFDFGVDEVHLTGLTSLNGLDATLLIV